MEKQKQIVIKDEVIEDFSRVINCHCLENSCNTPDFILAEYLWDCLETYNKIHNANEKWYGKELKII